MKTRKLNDGDTHGYLDGDKLIRTQNGLSPLRDNTHAEIGQNGKIVRIFKEEKKVEEPKKKVIKRKTKKEEEK